MAYVKQNWENLPNRTTPLSAQRLNHLETQYDEAVTYFDDAITDETSNVRNELDQLYTRNGVRPRFMMGGDFKQVEPIVLDNARPRIVESTTREYASFSPTGSWRNSKITLQRFGNKIVMSGVLKRNDANGDPVKIEAGTTYSLIGVVSQAFIPNKSIYDNGVNIRTIMCRGVGVGQAGLLADAVTANNVLTITKAGILHLFAASGIDVDYVVVDHIYDAEESVWIDSLDYPEYDGTYFKSWMRDKGMIEGVNYSVIARHGFNPRLSSLSIHTGQGEYGAETAATALAEMNGASLYLIDAISGGYNNMHMNSNGFDDPRALALVNDSERCVSFHGAADNPNEPSGTSFVGGRDVEMRLALIDALNTAGFPAADAALNYPNLAGTGVNNICNKTSQNAGVQVEMDNTLRRSFFTDDDYSRQNRINTTTTFADYMSVISFVCNQFT